ncbi:TonB-dependent receptor [Edaphobacter dinghuensis]|nr:TonB-dependent receptor [Edaphobacter dinghuensis]
MSGYSLFNYRGKSFILFCNMSAEDEGTLYVVGADTLAFPKTKTKVTSMLFRSIRRTVIVLCLLALSHHSLLSQEFRGSVSGKVTDTGGYSLSQAEVQVHSHQDATDQTVMSNTEGLYRVPFLNPGTYDITISKGGFNTTKMVNVVVSLAQNTEVNAILSPATVSQEIVVSSSQTLVDTESADRGMTVEHTRVDNTPLQGQNIFAQAWSAPGVAVTSAAQRLRPFDVSGSTNMSINGGQPGGNEVLVDGTSALSQSSTVAYVPPVSATDEFRVQTSVYDAQYGWTSGGVVNVVTKSGTNQFHGSAYELLQNTVLDANTYNSNYTGQPRGSSHINTFGGSIGGPVFKNRVFGFFAYEELRQFIPDPFTTSVPTPLERIGDFSQSYYGTDGSGNKLLRTIYNPYSTRLNPATNKYVRDPFPGNVIPKSMMSQVALNVLAGLPAGNVAGNSVTNLNNLVNGPNSRKFTDLFDNWVARGDYVLSPSTRFFTRYSRNKLTEARGFIYSSNNNINPFDTTKNSRYNRENHNATVQFTHVLNSRMTLDLRTGFERFLLRNGAFQGLNYGLQKLGFSSDFANLVPDNIPAFNLAGYGGAGAQPQGISPISQGNAFQGLLYMQAGRHTFRIGGEVYLNRVYSINPGFSSGNFNFNTIFTGSDPNTANSFSGSSVASFLLGAPQSGYVDVNTTSARQQLLNSLFVQDDIHVSDRLVMNAGLRWDVMTPMTDRHNAVARGFDFNATSPLSVPGLTLKGGLLYAGVNGQPRGIYNPDWTNFGPRAGAAFRINDKTVLRGGYGLVYSQTFDDPGNAPGFSQETAMVTSVVAGIPANTLDNPFPNGIQKPIGAALGLSANLGQSLTFADPNRRVPWTQQYSVELQRELPQKVLFTLGYVGSHTSSLGITRSINEISAASLAMGTAYLSTSVSNPFAGLLPGTSLNSATVQRRQLLRPYPQFLSISEMASSVGRSTYNGMQTLLQKRMSNGSSVSFSYTYSKTLGQNSFANPQDAHPEKVVASWDVANSIQINGVYNLPVGRGQRWGADTPSAVRAVISGWRISALSRIQSGFPLTTPTSVVPTGVSAKLAHPTLNRWFNTCTRLSTGALQNCQGGESPVWATRASDTLQTWSTRLSYVRNPPIRNLDASIMQETPIRDGLALTLRVDFLNLMNTPQWFNGPVTDSTSSNFGQIAGVSDQSNLPRVIQLSAKFLF